ncbi:MAG: multicopper oxidase domain-containing protein [Anaerolineales bacterium]|nr:multicopper oxidase domain-containing protein [Anaerolineales bacterium]
MQYKTRSSPVFNTALALFAALLLLLGFVPSQALAAPSAAPLPPSTACTSPGTGLVTCELWATTGTITLPGGASLPIWGYSDSAAGAAQLPGPILIAQEGDQVQVTLHNTLGVTTALYFDGQAIPPDRTGIPVGATGVYEFTAATPGTFLYEAAPLSGAQQQAAMGLFGALIVRHAGAPGQAYANPASAFDDEALLVLSEIDPALNNNPLTFDMRRYQPKYWLINGKSYPDTEPIVTAAGNRLLLRYINAGQQTHTLAFLGGYQRFLSLAGAELPFYRNLVSEELGPGQSADALVTISASAPAGMRYPLYEAGMLLHNNGAPGFGGMITFITIPSGPGNGDTQGPAASSVSLSPNPANGSADVSVSATISDAATGGSNIQAAEFFIDSTGANGSGSAMSADDLDGFNSPVEAVSGLIPASTLAGLSSGNHTIYIHGQDSAGNWGSFNVAVLNLDKVGPTSRAIVLTPGVSSGSVDIAIQATGDDSASGNGDIVAAEYFIDIDVQNPPAPGSGAPLTVNVAAPIASLNGVIPAAVMSGLSEGAHQLYIRSLDSQSNWGDFATANLPVDRSGPTTASVSLIPSVSTGSSSVRVNASIADQTISGAQSNIVAAEVFIDALGAPGSGLPMLPTDGAFNSSTENVYAFIPQAQVNALPNGQHTVYVRGKDASGNWGAAGTAILTIDKAPPQVSGVNATPNPTNGAASITLTANAQDTATNIVAAEWFRNADPGVGMGTPMAAVDGAFDSLSEAVTASINITGWANGSHTLYVRAKDAAGFWSLTANTVLVVSPADVLFADSFESGDTSAWGLTTNPGAISVNAGAAMQGAYGMQVNISGSSAAYVTDLTPANEATYHARFYFNPRSTLNGTTPMDIFAAVNTAGQSFIRVQYRRTTAGGLAYQVRLAVQRAGGLSTTSWFNIADNTAHSIEFAWQSSTSATVSFYVDGVLMQTITGINTSAFLVDAVRLGPNGAISTGASGAPYFDAFVSRRSSYIGP